MINILSVNCGLAFAPYLSECAHSFLRQQAAMAQRHSPGGIRA